MVCYLQYRGEKCRNVTMGENKKITPSLGVIFFISDKERYTTNKSKERGGTQS